MKFKFILFVTLLEIIDHSCISVEISSNGTELKNEFDENDLSTFKFSKIEDQEQTDNGVEPKQTQNYEFYYSNNSVEGTSTTPVPTSPTPTKSPTPYIITPTTTPSPHTNSSTNSTPTYGPPNPRPTLPVKVSSTFSSSPEQSSPPPSTTDRTQETSSTPNTTTDITDREIEVKLDEMNNTLNNLKNQINSTKLLENSEILRNILNKRTMKSNNSLINTVSILVKLDKFSKSVDKELMVNFTDNMAENYNDVLDNNEAWANVGEAKKKTEMSSNILELIRTTGFNLGCNRNVTKNTKIIKSNIAIEIYSLDSKNTMHINLNGSKSGVILPTGMPEIDPDTGCDRGIAVSAVISKIKSYLGTNLETHKQINSNIIAFSIKNSRNSTQLSNIPSVQVILTHNKRLEFGDRVECVYWDFDQMSWSSKGCRFQPINSNRKLSICECNHLTNFAALMDVSGRETDTKVKDILTKVCCGLSIICLILTIASLTLVRALRNRRNNITCNLCLCLLIVNLLVVFGMDSTQNNELCQSIATILLYFILCSFSWMLMEGYHLYQMIVLVFSNIGYLRLIYLYAIGYGVPFVITLIALLSIGFNELKETDSYFCWISSPSHPYRVWSVAGPALFVNIVNGLILYLSLKEAYSARMRAKHTYQVDTNDNTIKFITKKLMEFFSRIKGFISLVVVLGITWISFVLYIHSFGQFFSYVFIILNGLQGVFIFCFHVLLNDKIRSVIRKTYLKNISSQSIETKTSATNSERSHTTHHSNKY